MQNSDIDSTLAIPFPDLAALPERVRARWEALPTKVNLFRMLTYSTGTFVELMDLTRAVFQSTSLGDDERELLVLMTARHHDADYEWDQHVVIGQGAGLTREQILAVGEGRTDDAALFSDRQRCLMRLGAAVLATGAAPPPLVKRALTMFCTAQVADAVIVIGFYAMLASFLKTFRVAIDAQTDGLWIKK